MKLLPFLWAFILGAVGLVVGYIAPITLSPDANQGPLLGIFVTGPGAAVFGFLLGLVVAIKSPSPVTRTWILRGAAVLVGAVTLYLSLPQPEYVGSIIEAETAGCMPTTAILPEAIAHREADIARVTWAAPRAGWKEDMETFARTDPGLVLELRILRERPIYKNRKPWNRGSLQLRPWRTKSETRRFYARFAGRSCGDYAGEKRAEYYPVTEGTETSEWPSRQPLTLLGLQVLGPVPPQYRELMKN